ncbi:MAG: DNA-directed RNA polymerase subunit omega [Clostridia bacterium]|nr:DNA-directed RNA polymerase subunit omega [Clostridia bacterium]
MVEITNYKIEDMEAKFLLTIAIAKRAREITDDIVLKGDIVEEKPVNLAIKDFNKGKFKISQ